jgi:hypothetical protein
VGPLAPFVAALLLSLGRLFGSPSLVVFTLPISPQLHIQEGALKRVLLDLRAEVSGLRPWPANGSRPPMRGLVDSEGLA